MGETNEQIWIRKTSKSLWALKLESKNLDLTRISPYRPAASENAACKGLTEDRTRSLAHLNQKTLAPRAATTEAI